mmetsp:Transcript_130/g.326  ORF Transcript_130/g.326 Transcript_130/m.326 type:complete len:579 (+) Transcript_130:89-1825(+)
MNNIPTARRGRTHYQRGPNDNRGLSGICSVIFLLLLFLLPPILFYGSEGRRHARYVTLREAISSDIVELNRDLDGDALRALERSGGSNLEALIPGEALVHGTAGAIDAVTTDGAMGVSIPGSLTLRRNTQYCQWQELQSQHCQTCTRTVSAKDGSAKEESYSCNCVTHYDYVKGWRNFRINSILFDQPGAHHNPQRDPMPSRMFTSNDATLTFREGDGAIDNVNDSTNQQRTAPNNNQNNRNPTSLQTQLNPTMLASGVRNQPWRRVDFVLNGMAPSPSFFSRLFSSIFPTSWTTQNTRYEPLQLLRDTPTSRAATEDNFVYVGQGGYFFSPYESSMTSQLLNYFVQYMEGSLFDWQLGDLMPSCRAGDVRFYYEVQDPNVVSVLGEIGRNDGVANRLEIRPRVMTGSGRAASDASSVGMVHSGVRSAEEMIIAEDTDSRNMALLFRGLLLLWSIPASRLIGVAFGREVGSSSLSVQAMGAIGTFATLLGGTWVLIWGTSSSSAGIGGGRDTVLLLVMGGYFVYLTYRSSVLRGVGRRWHAVWCRIGEWANVPPEWRVEDTYVPNLSRGDQPAHGKNL